MTQAYGEPSFYKLINKYKLSKSYFYPIITTDCELIIYKKSELIDPDVVPVCEFYYAGIRKYLINDVEYATYDLDKRELDRISTQLYYEDKLPKVDYDNIQWWLGRRPNPSLGTLDNLDESNQVIIITNRLLGQIENKSEEYHTVCIYKC